MILSEQQINMALHDINLQHNLRGIIDNCRRMPLPKSQILHVYDKYMILNKIGDRGGFLKQKVVNANDQAILKQFKSCMHGIFFDLDQEFPKITSQSQITKLNDIIYNNYPSFMRSKSSQQINIMSRSRFSQTPYQFSQLKAQKFNQQQKIDFIFSYLFDKLHILLLQYKEYYQLDNVEYIQRSIYQEFYNYAQQNQQSFIHQVSLEQEERLLKLNKNQQIMFQPVRTEKERQKSIFLEQVLDIVVENIDDQKAIKKAQQQLQTQYQKSSFFNKLRIGAYQLNPFYLFMNANPIIQSIKNKGLARAIAHGITKARTKSIRNSCSKYLQNTQQQQKKVLQIAEIILQVHTKHNIDKQYGLNPDEFKMIEQFLIDNQEVNIRILNEIFTQKQKQKVVNVLLQQIEYLKKQRINHQYVALMEQFLNQFMIINPKEQIQFMKSRLNSSKKGIKTTLSVVNTINQLPNIFYLLYVTYKIFQNHYCPCIRRIITRICHRIQNKFKKQCQNQRKQIQFTKFSLVHALKLIQSQYIKRTQICQFITNQKPFRQSQLPLIHQNPVYFVNQPERQHLPINEAQLYIQHQLNRIYTLQYKKQKQKPPALQLLKLSHSSYKKNITIFISGFLSQDTNKFQQWMGMLEPTYDSQIYALKWESKSIQHMMEFTIDSCKSILLAGAGIGIIGGPYVKAALILKQLYQRYNQNPFNPCFQVATLTGAYLADLLVSLFDDHFINLVGFSLGTQIINSCIARLQQKNKLHLINRLITMGGVADKKQMLRNLQPNQKNNPAPFIAWTNLYCETDNILKYLLRASMPSLDPIGLSQINPQKDMTKQILPQKMQIEGVDNDKIFEVDNINVSQFIDGHLTYRENMKIIARLIGIKDE